MGHDHGRDEIGRLSRRYVAYITRDAARLLKPGCATVHSGRTVLLPISPPGQRDAPRMRPGAGESCADKPECFPRLPMHDGTRAVTARAVSFLVQTTL